MDKIQHKILNLLSEIHNICLDNNISYTISAQLGAMAAATGTIPEGNYNAAVYMTLTDFIAFKNAVEACKRADRIIEGMDNNPRFPGFFFRYVDMSTTYYNYGWGDTYSYPGICVTIQILRSCCNHMKALKAKEKRFLNASYRYKKWGGPKAKLGRVRTAFNMLGGRKSYADRLFNSFMKAYQDKGTELRYSLMGTTHGLKTVEYPSYFYRKRQLVTLEERQFYASAFIPEQYNRVTGQNIEDYTPQISQPGFWILTSDTIPFTQAIPDMKEAAATARRRQHRWLHDQLHGAVVYFINKDWDILKCVSARLDLKAQYMPLRQAIIDAYNNMDFESLNDIYADYDAAVRTNYRKTRKTIYFDKMISDIYMAVLRNNGEAATAARLTAGIPHQWK